MLTIFLVHRNKLIFKNPDASDTGTYTCRLKGYRHISATSTLRVIGVLNVKIFTYALN